MLNKHFNTAIQDLFWALNSISVSYSQIWEGNSSATKFLKYIVMMKRTRLHSLDIWKNTIRNTMDGWYWIDDNALYQKRTKSNGELWNIDYLMSPISDSLSGSMIVLHNLYSTLFLGSWRLSFQFQGATCEQPVFLGSSWFHGGRQVSSHLPAWLKSRVIKYRI